MEENVFTFLDGMSDNWLFASRLVESGDLDTVFAMEKIQLVPIGEVKGIEIDWLDFETKKPVSCNDYVRSEDRPDEWFLKGKPVTGEAAKRLNGMHLPPGWRNVIVSRKTTDKVQAIGRDKVGRWQYRYSAAHIEKAARKKFNRTKLFGKDVPLIRRNIKKGIAKNDSRAFLLELENKTAIRAGTTADLRAKKKAYGLTTLQREHVTIRGDKIILDFVAKEGIQVNYKITDRVLATWLKERKAMTSVGERLFPDISAGKLNGYLKKIAGGKKYTIKDFRTYYGTQIAYNDLKMYAGKTLTIKEKKEVIRMVSEKVSKFLANSPAMARKSYIDPMVWDFIGGL